MIIAITGASGLVGTALGAALEADGHQVLRFVRRPIQSPSEIEWDPMSDRLDPKAIAEVDAIVHLAGENIGGRWTPERKQRIRESRIRSTQLLANTIVRHGGPSILISASAVGYYGDTGDALADEDSPPGELFLSEVCKEWEAAAAKVREAGVRLVHPRFGLVWSQAGGPLEAIARPIRWGVGGKLGSGRQFVSWITLPDAVMFLKCALADPRYEGAFNLVSPNPVTNAELTKTLGQILGRPTFMTAPAFALRLALGTKMADELLLSSQRATPRRLLELGFEWEYPTIREALDWALSATSRLG